MNCLLLDYLGLNTILYVGEKNGYMYEFLAIYIIENTFIIYSRCHS